MTGACTESIEIPRVRQMCRLSAMARLSRADSQRRTRRTLVRTARELFLRDGYFATSLERVAETAGYSKGAVYSNFRGKKELCLEVLDLIHSTKFAEVA